MTKRIEGGITYDPQTFDVQNRLISVTKVGTGVTTFTYAAPSKFCRTSCGPGQCGTGCGCLWSLDDAPPTEPGRAGAQ